MVKNTDKRRTFLICLALTVITAAVYYQVYTFEFIDYDDSGYVLENENIHNGITPETVKWALTAQYFSYWHPLTWLSHALDWQLYGSNPAGHHITSLIFHLANTLLFFLVLKQMTAALWPSAFVAVLFALHPLHVESVAWIAERKDVLSTFFWLLTIWAYVRFVRWPKISRYLIVVVFFAFAVMSKPMVVTLPFVLLLLDYWPLNRLDLSRDPKRRKAGPKRSITYLVVEKLPLFVMVIGLCTVTFIVQRKLGAMRLSGEYTLFVRIANALISYLQYIAKMFWPVRLAVFYPYPGQDVSLPLAGISAVILLALTGIVLRFAEKYKYLVTGWFWYLGTLVPVIGLVQVGVQARADRYTYVTLTGLFIIIAWSLPQLLAKWKYKKQVLTAAAVSVLLVMSIYTHFHLRYWRNTTSLFQHALDVTQDNYIAHLCMATYTRKHHDYDGTIYHCRQVQKIKPDDINVHSRLADTYFDAGRFEEAVEEYRIYLQKQPNDPNAMIALGITLGQLNKPDQAVECFMQAITIKPDLEAAHTNLGFVLARKGHLEQAAERLAEAIRINPDSVKAHYHFSHVLIRQGKINTAVIHLEKALQLDPDWPQVLNDLAWILSANKNHAIRNPQKAVRLAARACELANYQKPELLDTLSVAYAAAGDFDKAVETAQKALQLCRSAEYEMFKEEIEKRLILFKESKPYFETK
ncbi:MAG: tetratricopeptide repeat protein [Sedimentisphaerales bacterium]|nr:tetratricopeptide repeat protein [Sedimentisphaerales bacterium]